MHIRMVLVSLLCLSTASTQPRDEIYLIKYIAAITMHNPEELPKHLPMSLRASKDKLVPWASGSEREFVDHVSETLIQIRPQFTDVADMFEIPKEKGCSEDEIPGILSQRYYRTLRNFPEMKNNI